MSRLAQLLGVLSVAAAARAVPAVQAPAPAAAAELSRLAESSPRRAATRARAGAAADPALARLADQYHDAFRARAAAKIGRPVPVKVDAAKSGLAALTGPEKVEQLRDWALLAVYAQMDPDPRHAGLALGARPVSRLAPVGGLAEFDHGPGRVAAVDDGEYLVVVPPGPGGQGYDRATAARLLDARRAADGRDPDRVWVAAYRIDTPAAGEPTVAVWLVGPAPFAEFLTEDAGYVSRTVRTAGELADALAAIDDLLVVTDGPDEVRIEGRAFPRPAGGLAYRRVDAVDVAVVAGRDNQRRSPVGFSLDPWYDGAALKDALDRLAADPRAGGFTGQLKATADGLDPKRAYAASRGAADDETGLLKLLRSLRQAGGEAAHRLADEVEKAARPAEFQAPRYEGGTAGTEAGMTLFYTDLMAKLFVMGEVAAGDGPRKVPLPATDHFRLTPVPGLPVAEHHYAEARRLPDGRLWFGPRPGGVAVEADGRTVRFAPVANTLFMKLRENQTADEVDPTVAYATFARLWNAYAREIYAAEPEYERLNQLLKWSAVFSSPRPAGSRLAAVARSVDLPAPGLRFADWYAAGVKGRRLGVGLPLPFRAARAAGEPDDSLRMIASAPYTPMEGFVGTLSGGVTGYGPRDLVGRARPSPGPPFGLGATPDLSGFDAGKFGRGERTPRQDGPAFRLSPDGETTVFGTEGRRYFRDRVVEARPGTTAAQYRSRVEVGAAGRPPLAVEAELTGLAGPAGKGRAEVGAADGAIPLTVVPTPQDALRAVVEAIAAGRPIPRDRAEVREDPGTASLWVRLPGYPDRWTRVEPGSPTAGAGGMRFGPPGQRGGFRATFPEPDGPGYVRVRLTDQGAAVERSSAWLPAGGTARWRVRVPGSTAEVAAGRGGAELVVDGRLAELLKSVQEPREVYELARAVLRPADAGAHAELALPDAGLFLRRTGGTWDVARTPSKDAILAAGTSKRGPVILGVVELPEGAPKAVRPAAGRTLLVPHDATPQQRRDAARVAALLNESPWLLRPAEHCESLTVELVTRLKAEAERLAVAAARPVRVVLAGNKPQVELPGNLRLDLGEAQAAALARRALPAAWQRVANQTLVLDASALTAEQKKDVLNRLAKADPALAKQNTRVVLRTGAAGWEARTQALLDWRDVTVNSDAKTLQSIGRNGELAEGFLTFLRDGRPPAPDRWSAFEAAGRGVEVIVGHFDRAGTVLGEKLADAEAGRFRGKVVVLFVCNADPAAMLNFARVAMENGAHGVVIPSDRIGTKGVLALHELTRDPAAGDGLSAAEAIRAAYQPAIQRLKRVAAAPDPAAAFRAEYGDSAPAAERLFERLDKPEIERFIRELEGDMHQFRDTVRRPAGRRGPAAASAA